MAKEFNPSVYQDLMAKMGGFYENSFYPTGSVILDTVLSDGKGFPLGTLIEFSSDSGIGKSTLCLHICKHICATGKRVIYLDPEAGVNESQLQGIGLSKYMGDRFLYFPVVTFEDVEQVIDASLGDPELVAIVLDSITSTVPGKLLEKGKSIGDVEPGLHARYSAMFYQKYKSQLKEAQVTMFFINQTRTKIDFRRGATVEAAGGSAQKFYMDIRMQMRSLKKLEKTEQTADGTQTVPYGSENSIWAVKNRFARPFIPLPLTVLFGRGVSNFAAYNKWLANKGYIKQGGGGYFTITLNGEEYKVRGTAQVDMWIKEHLKEIKELVNSEGGFQLLTSE